MAPAEVVLLLYRWLLSKKRKSSMLREFHAVHRFTTRREGEKARLGARVQHAWPCTHNVLRLEFTWAG